MTLKRSGDRLQGEQLLLGAELHEVGGEPILGCQVGLDERAVAAAGAPVIDARPDLTRCPCFDRSLMPESYRTRSIEATRKLDQSEAAQQGCTDVRAPMTALGPGCPVHEGRDTLRGVAACIVSTASIALPADRRHVGLDMSAAAPGALATWGEPPHGEQVHRRATCARASRWRN